MPGPFSLITGSLLGEQDPAEAMGQYEDQQQAQNRRAIGLDPAGNPLPSLADGNAQAGQAASAATTLPPNQQPNATKSDVSLGHMMMDLARYEQRQQGFNQALGIGFAAFAQPRDRQMVSQMFNTTPLDAAKYAQNIQNLGMQQQGQDRMNALGQMIRGPQGDAIAQRLNISKDELIARYQADPQGVGNMIQSFAAPTDAMKNLEQIQTYNAVAPGLQGKGATDADLASLKQQILAGVAGPEAAQMISDQVTYRRTHGGQDPPWKDNIQGYRQWATEQGAISKSQSDASESLSAGVNKTEMLRQKLFDLKNNPGLAKILQAPNGSPMKIAARNALRSTDDSWQNDAVNAVLVNDPQALQAISELKEINGQEYAGAIDSLLGHGLRPSQTEVGAVREGFGQTKNINLFNSVKDYNAQAIDPLLTRLDEVEATGYGAAGELKSAPDRLRPFIHPTYLTGGRMHLDDGAAPLDWEKNVNRPMPPDLAAAAQARIQAEPGNAFAIRDGLRRKGYRVDF